MTSDILYYAVVIVASAVFCIALVIFLKRPFLKLALQAAAQIDLLLNDEIDDREKDRKILMNMLGLLAKLFLNLVLLALAVSIAVGIVYTYTILGGIDPAQLDLSSIYFYLSMIIGSMVILIKLGEKQAYSYWSKLLHYLILDNYHIGRFLLKRELKRAKSSNKIDREFVIVSGLARAGTTALSNLLYEQGYFHSISYANMPFLMSPKLWSKIYKPKDNKKNERAHGDKVLVGQTSIEALEEYFFKNKLNDRYIDEDKLYIHEIDQELMTEYLGYQELFRTDPQSIYLAKNNNFMLRFRSVKELHPNFKLILVFREPLQHAASLKKQNQNFTQQQLDDPFVLDYMDWLGHFEFGLNEKVFALGKESEVYSYEKDSINYWLAIWLNYHSYILNLNEDKLVYIDHADLLNRPESLVTSLLQKIGVSEIKVAPQPYIPNTKEIDPSEIDRDLLAKTEQVYEQLRDQRLPV